MRLFKANIYVHDISIGIQIECLPCGYLLIVPARDETGFWCLIMMLYGRKGWMGNVCVCVCDFIGGGNMALQFWDVLRIWAQKHGKWDREGGCEVNRKWPISNRVNRWHLGSSGKVVNGHWKMTVLLSASIKANSNHLFFDDCYCGLIRTVANQLNEIFPRNLCITSSTFFVGVAEKRSLSETKQW